MSLKLFGNCKARIVQMPRGATRKRPRSNETGNSDTNAMKILIEDFAAPTESLKIEALASLKNLYDTANLMTNRNFGPLRSLVVENLDIESIWEEIQMRNKPVLRYLKKYKRKFAEKNTGSSHEGADDDGDALETEIGMRAKTTEMEVL